MAITHFLLQSNITSSPLLLQTFRSRPLHSRANLKRNYNLSPCCIKTSPKSNIKCFIMNHKPQVEKDTKKVANESSLIWRSMENVMKVLRIPVMTGVVLGLLFLCDHRALAATGGRMGGRSSSSRSSSRSSGSRSYSSRSSRPSYSSSGTGSYSTLTRSPTPTKAATEAERHAFKVVMASVAVVSVFYLLFKCLNGDQHTVQTSVLKLQVGSLGTGRSLQKDLNRIAESADTSTSKGLNNVLQETILALLRHSEYCISGYSSVDVKRSVKAGEKRFDQLSIEERSKFDEETLVNVNNIIKKTTSQSSNGLCNEYIVVTIIVAARGVPELPPIKSSEQLKKALQNLASISPSNVVGVEVLWTPQQEDDSLTEQEMLKDYPLLHPL